MPLPHVHTYCLFTLCNLPKPIEHLDNSLHFNISTCYPYFLSAFHHFFELLISPFLSNFLFALFTALLYTFLFKIYTSLSCLLCSRLSQFSHSLSALWNSS